MGPSLCVGNDTYNKLRRNWPRQLALIGLLFSGTGAMLSLNAQGLTGRIAGTVLDPGGNAVPGAQVKITNTMTEQSESTITSANGEFVFSEVLPGTFDLRVQMKSFRV